jgi:hypothetical protein
MPNTYENGYSRNTKDKKAKEKFDRNGKYTQKAIRIAAALKEKTPPITVLK